MKRYNFQIVSETATHFICFFNQGEGTDWTLQECLQSEKEKVLSEVVTTQKSVWNAEEVQQFMDELKADKIRSHER